MVGRAPPEISGMEVGDGGCTSRLDDAEEASAVLPALEVEESMLEVVLLGFDETKAALAPNPAQSKPVFAMKFDRRPTNHILIKVQDSIYIF